MSTHFSQSTPRRGAQARLNYVVNPLTPSGYTELNTLCDKLREMRPLVRFDANTLFRGIMNPESGVKKPHVIQQVQLAEDPPRIAAKA